MDIYEKLRISDSVKKYLAIAESFSREGIENKFVQNFKNLDFAIIFDLPSSEKEKRIKNNLEILENQSEKISSKLIKNFFKEVAILREQQKNFKEAYKWLNKYIFFLEKQNEIINEMEKQYNITQDQLRISLLAKEKELQAEKLKNEKKVRNLFVLLILIVSIASFVVYFYYRKEKKAKKIIFSQKEEITKQRDEIKESIVSAKRIQEALLPEVSILNKFFKESFIIFIPRDIVSGDFYWFNQINEKEILIAVADCTGHGVPGAFITTLGIKVLNEIIETEKSPEKILQNLNVIIKENLQAKTEQIKEGMDIALIRIIKTDKEIILEYSGANRPCWIWQSQKKELLEINSTHWAIGGITPLNQEFEKYTLKLENEDIIYLFSDGFPDQIGGQKQKKLMKKGFKELILQNVNFSLLVQKENLKKFFEEYKSTSPIGQVDDVLLIAIKI